MGLGTSFRDLLCTAGAAAAREPLVSPPVFACFGMQSKAPKDPYGFHEASSAALADAVNRGTGTAAKPGAVSGSRNCGIPAARRERCAPQLAGAAASLSDSFRALRRLRGS
eukprot:gene8156-biopygen10579